MNERGELLVQENARRFATTRDVFYRQRVNSLLSGLEDELANITAARRAGDLARWESTLLTTVAIEDTAFALAVLTNQTPEDQS